MSIIVVQLSGSMAMIIGGRVSLGPPVGVIVEAHLVKSAAMKSSTMTAERVVVICCVIFRLAIAYLVTVVLYFTVVLPSSPPVSDSRGSSGKGLTIVQPLTLPDLRHA